MKKTPPRDSLRLPENRLVFRQGLRDGVPIGLGYLAVSFSLGIAARNAGMTAFQSFLTSALCNASAGEYAGFTMIQAGAGLLELALMILIANARYLLMSFAMSQRLRPDTGLLHRLLMGFYITDEFFAAAVARPGWLNPNYTYGAAAVAAPCWAFGTALGCIAGELMPARAVSALSVALFGMFLAVIIPPARRSRVIAGLIAVCFAASWAAGRLFGAVPAGTRTIVLTVALSAAAALLFPKEPEEGSGA